MFLFLILINFHRYFPLISYILFKFCVSRPVKAFRKPSTILCYIFVQAIIRYLTQEPWFVQPEIITQSYDLLDIDLQDDSIFRKDSKIFVGGMAKRYPRSIDVIDANVYITFLRDTNNFYVKRKSLPSRQLCLKLTVESIEQGAKYVQS